MNIKPNILPDLSAIMAEIEKLKAENAALKAKPQAALRFKVSDKGALSVYGLQRFPVTLYKGQWQRLIASVKALEEFIEANADELTEKGE